MKPFSPHRLLAALGLALVVVPLAHAQADHQYTAADVAAGSRLYSSQCSLCHGVNGDGVAGIDLRRGQFRRAVSDDDLMRVIASGVPGSGMPAFGNLPAAEIGTLVAFIRAGFDPSGMAVKIGSPARGQALFEGKGNCSSCHRVNGVGSRVAPDLSDVGAVRPPASLQRSLLNPSSQMMPINRPVRIVTRDGQTVQGRRLNEDTYTVQIIDSNEQLRSFTKSELRQFEVSTTSTMPPASRLLSSEEIADVIGYLLSLKGLP